MFFNGRTSPVMPGGASQATVRTVRTVNTQELVFTTSVRSSDHCLYNPIDVVRRPSACTEKLTVNGVNDGPA